MSGLFLYSDEMYKQAVVKIKVRNIAIILKASLGIGRFFICSGFLNVHYGGHPTISKSNAVDYGRLYKKMRLPTLDNSFI